MDVDPRGVGGRRSLIDCQSVRKMGGLLLPLVSQKMGVSQARKDRTHLSILLLPSQSVNSAHNPCCRRRRQGRTKGMAENKFQRPSSCSLWAPRC